MTCIFVDYQGGNNMDIKSVNSQGQILPQGKPMKEKLAEKDKDVSSPKVENNPAVKYEKSEKVEEKYITYDKTAVDKLKAEAEQRHANLRNMVKELLKRQGLTFKDVFEDGKVVKVDEQTRLEAQASIEEGGEFSVDAVATRIVDFAKAISGGDKAQIGKLKAAIEEGFKQAKEVFGGELPEISQKTYDEVMKRMDEWANE